MVKITCEHALNLLQEERKKKKKIRVQKGARGHGGTKMTCYKSAKSKHAKVKMGRSRCGGVRVKVKEKGKGKI